MKPSFLLAITSDFLVFVSLVLLILAVVLVNLSDDDGLLGFLPDWTLLVMVLFSSLVFLVSTTGAIAGHTQRRGFLLCFFFSVTVTILISLLSTIFLGLYANDKAPGALDRAGASAQDELEAFFIDLASSDPVEWLETQEVFSCCGIDLEATYVPLQPGQNTTELLLSQLSGPGCNDAGEFAAIVAIQSIFTEFSDEAAASADSILGEEYFCRGKVGALAEEYTLYAAIAAGFFLLVQFVQLVCAFKLIRNGEEEDSDEHRAAKANELTGTDPTIEF